MERIIGFDDKVIEYQESYIFWFQLAEGQYELTQERLNELRKLVRQYYEEPFYQIQFVDMTEHNISKYLSGNGLETGTLLISNRYSGIDFN